MNGEINLSSETAIIKYWAHSNLCLENKEKLKFCLFGLHVEENVDNINDFFPFIQ